MGELGKERHEKIRENSLLSSCSWNLWDASQWESVEVIDSSWQPPQGTPADHLVLGLGSPRRADRQEGEMDIIEEE